jgi:hypothetical protein
VQLVLSFGQPATKTGRLSLPQIWVTGRAGLGKHILRRRPKPISLTLTLTLTSPDFTQLNSTFHAFSSHAPTSNQHLQALQRQLTAPKSASIRLKTNFRRQDAQQVNSRRCAAVCQRRRRSNNNHEFYRRPHPNHASHQM